MYIPMSLCYKKQQDDDAHQMQKAHETTFTVNVEIFLGNNFHGQATPTKIKPTKICTDEELVTAITTGYLQKYCDHKIFYIYGSMLQNADPTITVKMQQ